MGASMQKYCLLLLMLSATADAAVTLSRTGSTLNSLTISAVNDDETTVYNGDEGAGFFTVTVTGGAAAEGSSVADADTDSDNTFIITGLTIDTCYDITFNDGAATTASLNSQCTATVITKTASTFNSLTISAVNPDGTTKYNGEADAAFFTVTVTGGAAAEGSSVADAATGTDNTFIITGLTANVCYDVAFDDSNGVTSDLENICTDKITLTATAKTPTSLTVHVVNVEASTTQYSTAAEDFFSVTTPAGVAVDGAEVADTDPADGGANLFTISGLTDNTCYHVTFTTDDATPLTSGAIELCTHTVSLTATARAATTITVHVENEADSDVVYSDVNFFTLEVDGSVTAGDNNQFTISGLVVDTCYDVTFTTDGDPTLSTGQVELCTTPLTLAIEGETLTESFKLLVGMPDGMVVRLGEDVTPVQYQGVFDNRLGASITREIDPDDDLLAVNDLEPGAQHVVTVTADVVTDGVNTVETVVGTFCSKPESPNAEESFTTTQAVALVVRSGNSNPNSDVIIVPSCNGTEEEPFICVRSEDNAGEFTCIVDGLDKTGCLYTFDVRMFCEVDGVANSRVESAPIEITQCTNPGGVDPDGFEYTATTTTITITAVVAEGDGMFESWSVVRVGDRSVDSLDDGISISDDGRTIQGLEPGTCTRLEVVLKCGADEGVTSPLFICTDLEIELSEVTTTGFSVAWPIKTIAPRTTANYTITLNGETTNQIDHMDGTAVPFTEVGDPGSKHTLSSLVTLDDKTEMAADPTVVCLKPVAATIDQNNVGRSTNSLTYSGLSIASGLRDAFRVEATCDSATVTAESQAGTLDTVHLAGLVHGCAYQVNVRSFCQATTGDTTTRQYSDDNTEERCTNPMPLATDALVVSTPTTSGVTVQGLAVQSGVATLELQFRSSLDTANCPNLDTTLDVDATNQERVFADLQAGCVYQMTMKPVCIEDKGTDSTEDDLKFYSSQNTVRSFCTTPEALTPPTITAATTSLTLTGLAVTDGSFTDIVIGSSCGQSDNDPVTVTEVTDPIQLTGLTSGCLHQLTMRARCYMTADGDKLQGAEYSTSVCTKPVTPAITIDASTVTSTGFSISSFSVASGQAGQYHVLVTCGKHSETPLWGTGVAIAGDAAQEVTELKAGCNHKVEAFADCLTGSGAIGQSSDSLELSQCTTPLAAVSAQITARDNDTSLTIGNIQVPDDSYFESYTVDLTRPDNADWTFEMSDKIAFDDSFEAVGLEAATLYDVHIVTYCGDKQGPEFVLEDQLTQPAAPVLELEQVTSSQCDVSLAEPTLGTLANYRYAVALDAAPNSHTTRQFTGGVTVYQFPGLQPSSDHVVHGQVLYQQSSSLSLSSQTTEINCYTAPTELTEVEVPADRDNRTARTATIYGRYDTALGSQPLQIRVFNGDVELSYQAATEELSDNTYRRTVIGLNAATQYTLKVYSSYGGSMAATSTEQTFHTYGCSESENCRLRPGMEDEPQNYACAAGWVGDATGVCSNTCSDNLRPDSNGNCIARCAYDTSFCTCTDAFDLLTCECMAGTVIDPNTGDCSRTCDPGVAECRDTSGLICSASSASNCQCQPEFIPAISSDGGSITCVALPADKCEPYYNSNRGNICQCSTFNDIATCQCIAGYQNRLSNPGFCAQVDCHAGNDNCLCEDAADDETCKCRAGYGPVGDGTCTNKCWKSVQNDKCVVDGTTTKCSESTDENAECTCLAGYGVKWAEIDDTNRKMCYVGCYSDTVEHYPRASATELYQDSDKCTCTDATDITTCTCLAGYVLNDGECTRECVAAAGSRCVKDAQNTQCSSAEDTCFCRPGYVAHLDENGNIDCNELAADQCDPTAESQPNGCHCTDWHDVDTCECESGYRRHPDSFNCVRYVQVRTVVRIQRLFNPSLANKASAPFKSQAAADAATLLAFYKTFLTTAFEVVVTGYTEGSTEIEHEVYLTSPTGQTTEEAQAQAEEDLYNGWSEQNAIGGYDVLVFEVYDSNDVIYVPVTTTAEVVGAAADDDDRMETYLLVLMIAGIVAAVFLIIFLVVFVIKSQSSQSDAASRNDYVVRQQHTNPAFDQQFENQLPRARTQVQEPPQPQM